MLDLRQQSSICCRQDELLYIELYSLNADILKIGQIQAKEMDLNIYNLHLQVSLNISSDTAVSQKRIIAVSLGNLNTTGI